MAEHRRSTSWVAGLGITAILAAAGVEPASSGLIDPDGCPRSSTPASHRGASLQGFAQSSDAGIVFDDTRGALRLKKAGGLFQSTLFPVSDNFNVAAAGDFDGDGWADLVVSSSGNRFVRFYKNRTFENPEPNWDDPSAIRAPKFVRTRDIEPAASTGGHASMAAGDFDNDGHLDFVLFRNESGGDDSRLEAALMYRGRGDGSFRASYTLTDDVGALGYLAWSSTNVVAADYNGDGWLDLVYGTKLTSASSSGAVLALVNDCPDTYAPGKACSRAPKFEPTPILTGVDLGDRGVNALVFRDFTGDGRRDLVVGSPSSCNNTSALRLYPGLVGGGFDTSYQRIPGIGAATVMLAADFSLDGKPDLVYGTDEWRCGSHLGGQAFYYRSDGDAAPFSGGVSQQLSWHQSHAAGNLYDFDLGVVLDYDNDPDKTPDFLIADGNDSGTFFLFANRVVQTYVECGEVASGVIDLGALRDEEMVVTSARLSPEMSLPAGTSVTFYMSNVDPPVWHEAHPCADDASAYCVTFPSAAGRDIRWKASMCSNAPHRTRTPTLDGVEIRYDYAVAREHYRGGVVVHDGVAYVGAFRQPGNRGRFYAINAALDTTYWEAGAKLDAMPDGARRIYTATTDGAERLDFTVANASSNKLRKTLGASSRAQAEAVIAWQRSARFGVGNSDHALSRLGAVETSTPAVLSPPGLPWWYEHATPADKAALEGFVSAHADRPHLVLFGSRDGAIHALHTDPTDIAHPRNGIEAWAFVPAKIAFELRADMASGTTRAYPDGSPTLADVRWKGAFRTVALVAAGNGGDSIVALDVTETVHPVTGEILGPQPLWHAQPGDSSAGRAYSKPVVGRVRINGKEEFIAIMATGPDNDPAKGKTVVAVDMENGHRMWRFEARCAVTSDLVLFETDDPDELGEPTIDGFVDRLVFADACGYVYKLDPAVKLPGIGVSCCWNRSAGPIEVRDGTGSALSDPSGNPIEALFYVGWGGTTGALGEDRPIAGSIAARTDASGRMVLFFGTGGVESFDATRPNAFYAVYADTGAIRSALAGACLPDGRCEKFYAGVVATADQVLITRTIDPPIGQHGSCDLGASVLQALALDPDVEGEFVTQFEKSYGAAVVAGLHGHAGAVYTATVGGQLVRVGTPRASDAGDDSRSGRGQGFANGAGGSGSGALTLLGWRQVL